VPKSGSCTGGSCQDDTREEDDSQGSAKPIGVGESINAHMCPADADWHSFTLASSGNVTVTLSGAPEVDLDIALQNSSGQTVGFSANTGSQEEIVASSLAAGTYFVEVFPYQPSEPQSDYQLTVMTGGSTGGAECCGDTCDDGTIRDCVCLNWDEECCNGWDAGCASAVNLCDDACQATDSDPSCCAMHPEPRCDNNAVERCVCIDNGMTACCSVGWTQDCVTKATQCGASC
jgi:hypothetical protein